MPDKKISKEDIIIRNYRTSDYHATLGILKELNELLSEFPAGARLYPLPLLFC